MLFRSAAAAAARTGEGRGRAPAQRTAASQLEGPQRACGSAPAPPPRPPINPRENNPPRGAAPALRGRAEPAPGPLRPIPALPGEGPLPEPRSVGGQGEPAPKMKVATRLPRPKGFAGSEGLDPPAQVNVSKRGRGLSSHMSPAPPTTWSSPRARRGHLARAAPTPTHRRRTGSPGAGAQAWPRACHRSRHPWPCDSFLAQTLAAP